MDQAGDLSSESEDKRVDYNKELTAEIERLEAVDAQEDLGEIEAQMLQKKLESLKRERFSNSTDQEKTRLIEEKLPLLKDWADDGTPVSENMFFDPWGFVPESGSLPEKLAKEIKRIKRDNPDLGLV